jgi:hypothetical protein
MRRWQFEPNSNEDVQEFIGGLAKLHLGGTLINEIDLDSANTLNECNVIVNKTNMQFAQISAAINGESNKKAIRPYTENERRFLREQHSNDNHAIGYGLAKKVRDAGNMEMLVGPNVVLNSLLMLPDDTVRRLAEQYSRKGSRF